MMRKITESMVSSLEWSPEDIFFLGFDPNRLVGDQVDVDGRLYYYDGGQLFSHHFRVREWAV